jgi:DMSO/TMAO reductase YedYZ heme-binding membrane subunit
MNKKENRQFQIQQYTAAATMAFVLTAIVAAILYARRGDIFNLFIMNKAIASGSLLTLALVYLIGPLNAVNKTFAKFLQYRKELGITAFFMAFVHVFLSVFVLTEQFPFRRYFNANLQPEMIKIFFGIVLVIAVYALERTLWQKWIADKQRNVSIPWALPFTLIVALQVVTLWFMRPAAALGTTGLLLLFALYVISLEKVQSRLDAGIWWKLQQWGGRLALVIIFLHFAYRKYRGWNEWLLGNTEVGNVTIAPASMFVGIVVFMVIVLRLSMFAAPTYTKQFVMIYGVATVAIIAYILWLGRVIYA